MTNPPFDWDHLRIFLVCLKRGSFRGAAEELGVNHATVTRAMRSLEEDLGTRLFDRGGTGLSLTQSGEIIVPHAEIMEQQSFHVARRVAGLDNRPSGLVRISIAPSMAQDFLAPILPAFSTRYPDIDVQVIATNQVTDLSRHETDISVRVANDVQDDVVGRRIVRFVATAYAAPDYLASRPHLTVGDGREAEWVGWNGDASWIQKSPFPNARQRHHLPEVQMQLKAAAAGLGLAWVPVYFGDREPGVVRVPGVSGELGRWIWILLHSDLRRTARVRAFVDFLVDELKAQSAAFTLDAQDDA